MDALRRNNRPMTPPAKVVGNELRKYSGRMFRLRGLAMGRILIGLAGVNFYVSSYSQRRLLWGPNGYLNTSLFRVEAKTLHLHTLYSLSTSTTYFNALFLAGLLVAGLFTVFGGRTLAVAHAVMLWSIYNRNPGILDGGDNLVRIVVIALPFVVTDAYFSPVAAWRRQRLARIAPPHQPRALCLLHNAAVLLITFQIGILYFTAGMWKIAGPLWQDGTAMYYVNRTLDFQFVSLGWLVTNGIVLTAMSYFAILANIAFPIGLFTRRLRFVTISFAMVMHIGIIFAMGLTGFGLAMIGADLTCLSDEECETLRALVRKMRSSPALSRTGDHESQAPTPPARSADRNVLQPASPGS
jgi:hypothetical protein